MKKKKKKRIKLIVTDLSVDVKNYKKERFINDLEKLLNKYSSKKLKTWSYKTNIW